ncbi:ABC transporter permease [Compostimonas suwonensis]|uniref:Autoinducer 2 import system permease protein LsrD n=1 Tax=Compostimonas suwonensis TaxID=1048394 RepID=A0A2M9BYS4_9MICO|nr:ABC transporter permease [Compostimonas suwonensis]PJJ63238.1 ribose transport system permease protein [Compostimonas suwonensis]
MISAFTRYVRREPSALIAYGVLAVILVVWVVATPNLGIVSVTNTFAQKLPLALAAIGATIVIVSKGIDLSIGGTLTLVNVIVANGTIVGGDLVIWIVIAMVVALLAGAVNGFLVAVLGLPALIVTLATQSVMLGIALYILPTPGGELPVWFTNLPLQLVGPIPLVILLFIVIPLVLWWPIRRSRFGTALYAVGNDEGAAFTSGVAVVRTTFLAYVLAAFFAGLGGLFITMNAGSGDPSIGVPYTLNAIAAAVIGGVALSGGRGTIAGPIAGALVLSFINNLLFSLGVNTYWQYLVTGVLLIGALAIPYVIRRLRQRKAALV